MILYFEVTKDKYQFPLYCAESLKELADKCNVTVNCVNSTISKWRHGKIKRPRFIAVEVDDEL